MKRLMMIAICLMATGVASAQNAPSNKQTAPKKVNPYKTGVSGFVRNARNFPIADVQVFVYGADSSGSIVSSGYTDATGYYETNYTAPGKYTVKFVYPTAKSAAMAGVPVKKGLTNISVKMNEPEADTILLINGGFVTPKPVEKKKTKK